MKGVSKLVAVVLAMALLAMPAAGLVNCRISGGTAHGCCATMMAMQQATPAMDATPSGQSCCNLSSGKTAPAAQLQGPSSSPAVVNPVATTAPETVAPVRSELQDVVPLKVLSSSQAVLCTFLI
ncbi:MAG: hypothetical protein LAO06_08165 [Acidobacteriia bacterium]|nr:hypothetical protein [Terriglobia bacterium]